MPEIEYVPLIRFALNNMQSLMKDMISTTAAYVDPGGRNGLDRSQENAVTLPEPQMGRKAHGTLITT